GILLREPGQCDWWGPNSSILHVQDCTRGQRNHLVQVIPCGRHDIVIGSFSEQVLSPDESTLFMVGGFLEFIFIPDLNLTLESNGDPDSNNVFVLAMDAATGVMKWAFHVASRST